MAKYTNIQKEETLKSLVFNDYFDAGKFGYEPNVDNIDFVITNPRTRADGLFVAVVLFFYCRYGKLNKETK